MIIRNNLCVHVDGLREMKTFRARRPGSDHSISSITTETTTFSSSLSSFSYWWVDAVVVVVYCIRIDIILFHEIWPTCARRMMRVIWYSSVASISGAAFSRLGFFFVAVCALFRVFTDDRNYEVRPTASFSSFFADTHEKKTHQPMYYYNRVDVTAAVLLAGIVVTFQFTFHNWYHYDWD